MWSGFSRAEQGRDVSCAPARRSSNRIVCTLTPARLASSPIRIGALYVWAPKGLQSNCVRGLKQSSRALHNSRIVSLVPKGGWNSQEKLAVLKIGRYRCSFTLVFFFSREYSPRHPAQRSKSSCTSGARKPIPLSGTTWCLQSGQHFGREDPEGVI